MIFLSHNHLDKPVVEQIALKFAGSFGVENVFYDSWAIQPGEGIIDKMSSGLGNCKFFFFFVSENSLKSKMVSLEWQNALILATKEQCKIIPIRLDQSVLPPIMSQNLYIDLYTVGLDAAIAQIADVVNGVNTYRKSAQKFSNVCFSIENIKGDFFVTLKAKHYLEPIASFVILFENTEAELECKVENEDPFKGGFNKGIKLDNGITCNGYLASVFRGLTPAMPLKIRLKPKDGIILKLIGVLHQISHERWDSVPYENG